MAYEEINPEEWKPITDGDFIEGHLLTKRLDVGVNHSMIYVIETLEGKKKNVWGSAILDSKMDLIDVGSKIKITYQGLGKAKSGKNAPKIFKVEVDKE